MLVYVKMNAFGGGALRPVEVPDDIWNATAGLSERLEAVFEYGQNEFQPRPFPSVSVGDVILYEGQHRVANCGFEEVR